MADMSWIGGAAAAGGGLVGSIISNAVNWNMNEKNIQLQRDTNEQNEALMREAWARDDSARQRMVKDLEAAGLSKWLAAGASPMTSSPISLTAPKNDFKPDVDGLSHAYQNYMQAVQTQKQNDILDKQGQILDNNVEESEAAAKIKKHDAEVFANRPDVASTDPATLKYVAEAINALAGRNSVGQSIHSGVQQFQESLEAVKAARAEKKKQKEIQKAENYKSVYGNYKNEPMTMSAWIKQNQIDVSTPDNQRRAAYLYNQYRQNFYKEAK